VFAKSTGLSRICQHRHHLPEPFEWKIASYMAKTAAYMGIKQVESRNSPFVNTQQNPAAHSEDDTPSAQSTGYR
jgi:hypothetical protein